MYRKVTFTLPQSTILLLEKTVASGERSSFTAKAIEEKLIKTSFEKSDAPSALEKFFALSSATPKYTRKELLEAKTWGRK